MVLELNFGPMARSILANGSTERPKVKEHFTILTVTYLWDNFKMTKLTEPGNTCTKTHKLTKVNGLRTCNMVKVKKICPTAALLRDISKKVAKMVMEFTSGLIIQCMKECGKAVKSMAEVFMSGRTVGDTKVSGVKTNSMEKEPTNGPMVECTQANIKWTRNMATAAINGQMERNMKASGKTGSNTDKVNLLTRRVSVASASGKKDKG